MTKKTKVALVGAGSYVFSSGLLYDLIYLHQMPLELVLIDLDLERAELMAGVARRLALERDTPLEVTVTSHREALQGADFVTSSVAVQLQGRWDMDKAILGQHGIREILSENGGLGGLSYTLRAVQQGLAIARDMERWCPKAWLLNVSNPLPRVLSAVLHHTQIRALGFCNVAHGGEGGYHNLAQLLQRPLETLKGVSAGINHFAWLLELTDRDSGQDLLPQVYDALKRGAWADRPLTLELWRRFGRVPLSGDTHIGEFIPFDPALMVEHQAHHGTPLERAAHFQVLRELAAGSRPVSQLLKGRSWERPGDVIHALSTGQNLQLDMVNLANAGFISSLPEGVVVEVPAQITGGEVCGVQVPHFPEPLAELLGQVSRVITLSAEAAATGNVALLEQVIELDPAIANKPAARKALPALLERHCDVLPQFASL